MAKRDLMLNEFKTSGELEKLCGLTPKQIEMISFRDNKVQEPVVMSLKKMLTSFEDKDTKQTMIKKVNIFLEAHAKEAEK